MSSTDQQPTAAEMRAFLKRRYKHSRFEGRDGTAPLWENYSEVVVQSALRDLAESGRGFISHHEAASGQ